MFLPGNLIFSIFHLGMPALSGDLTFSSRLVGTARWILLSTLSTLPRSFFSTRIARRRLHAYIHTYIHTYFIVTCMLTNMHTFRHTYCIVNCILTFIHTLDIHIAQLYIHTYILHSCLHTNIHTYFLDVYFASHLHADTYWNIFVRHTYFTGIRILIEKCLLQFEKCFLWLKCFLQFQKYHNLMFNQVIQMNFAETLKILFYKINK